MGLLKSILSDALGDGISKAVSKAVEKTVAPAAEKFAQKQADAIGKVADAQAKALDQAASSMNQATSSLQEASDKMDAAAAGTLEVKDPETGQTRPMTEEEIAKAKEASQALKGLGMMFSGAVAQAKKEAEEEAARKAAAEKAIFENWEETFPAYPKWDVGGEQFELEEDMPMNGYPSYRLSLKGRPYLVELYAAKLRAAGFQAKGCSNPLDLNADTYYKIIDGVCHAWNRSDACYDGNITVSFFVDNYKPAPKKEPVSSSSDLKGLAKGIFKKLF